MMRAARQRGTPILGVCFGGQLLAASFGGVVEEAPVSEIGWYEVYEPDGSPNGARHPLGPGPWFQWHHDRFTPPPEADVLAVNDNAVQLFRLGRCVGTQFHPEVTYAHLEGFLSGADEEYLADPRCEPGGTAGERASPRRPQRPAVHRPGRLVPRRGGRLVGSIAVTGCRIALGLVRCVLMVVAASACSGTRALSCPEGTERVGRIPAVHGPKRPRGRDRGRRLLGRLPRGGGDPPVPRRAHRGRRTGPVAGLRRRHQAGALEAVDDPGATRSPPPGRCSTRSLRSTRGASARKRCSRPSTRPASPSSETGRDGTLANRAPARRSGQPGTRCARTGLGPRPGRRCAGTVSRRTW